MYGALTHTQGTVNNADTFANVFPRFQQWLEKHSLGRQDFAIVTDG